MPIVNVLPVQFDANELHLHGGVLRAQQRHVFSSTNLQFMHADIFHIVYANSFYAALNTRRSVRGRGTENDRTTVPTFLMVAQTATSKNEGHEGPGFSTVTLQ